MEDSYVQGAGRVTAKLLGLFTVAELNGGGEIARGEFIRWFAEAAWYPTALLPSQDVRWQAETDTSANATIVVRDAVTGTDLAVVDEAAHTPLCAFSADGSWLATTGNDATVHIWEVRTRQEQARLELQAGARAVVFAAGGSRVAVLDEEGAVRIWPLGLADILAQACRRMRYAMSTDDWQRFHAGESCRPTCAGLGPAP